ncbi:hypothetical protein [Burkholderia sp. Ac-20379]|uniref:hypothetical protein n=1 Tax=Burkholderia sp. Ac-20379 TaxID=2703900 RepID=UPI00197D62F9|nr:hypothetical protein [Burkholderia sp. Ac-20379]MBN3728390.1 hypothetical protein [Burkholderia sp. Ac-20379]
MTPNADSPPIAIDRISTRPFALWLGLAVIYVTVWELYKGVITLLLVSAFLLLPLAIGWLVGSLANAVRGRWRSAASTFLAPLLVGVLMMALPAIGLDSQRVHFLLVKYPHEIALHLEPHGTETFHMWSWGLNAAPLSPGVAYTLEYDPTDAILRAPKVLSKSVRPMGDHFYVVIESEDGTPV